MTPFPSYFGLGDLPARGRRQDASRHAPVVSKVQLVEVAHLLDESIATVSGERARVRRVLAATLQHLDSGLAGCDGPFKSLEDTRGRLGGTTFQLQRALSAFASSMRAFENAISKGGGERGKRYFHWRRCKLH
jgi:hypothetical protein